MLSSIHSNLFVGLPPMILAVFGLPPAVGWTIAIVLFSDALPVHISLLTVAGQRIYRVI
uniref:Uncharacterized protein n=1 Tax=Arundo donax TaxID=35708 RepID=A0A0A9DED0_ARUDO